MLSSYTLLVGKVKRDHVLLGVDDDVTNPMLNS